MRSSLARRQTASLPSTAAATTTFSVKNLQFASIVEPDNVKISQKLLWTEQKRKTGLSTVPSTIKEELETNPFIAGGRLARRRRKVD
ncbi:Metallo-hydrolase/oxidoreductase superfamily protein [Perilla frutescens var. frutescens]|nr:Metallo-hydrolase/oxidoreductase superfamily protein [Perilla frutescens var. frutescens]